MNPVITLYRTYQTNNVMKKIMLYLTAAGFMFASCQKDEEMTTTSSPGAKTSSTLNVSPVPSNFTQKVLIEKLTGQSELAAPGSERFFTGYCSNTTTSRIFVASLYNSGYLTVPQTNRLIQSAGSGTPSLPMAMINRTASMGSPFIRPYAMTNPINSIMQATANCGLAMTSITSGRTASVNIHTGFNANLNSIYRVNVYLIEDRVINMASQFSQANGYNTVVGSPYYNLGNPILNYMHMNVVRGVLSGENGDLIQSSNTVPGGTQVFTYRADLPVKSNNASKFYVLAFITDQVTKEVLNVQMGELGTTKDWN